MGISFAVAIFSFLRGQFGAFI